MLRFENAIIATGDQAADPLKADRVVERVGAEDATFEVDGNDRVAGGDGADPSLELGRRS